GIRDATVTGVQTCALPICIGRTFQLTRIFTRLTVMENMHVAAQREGARALLSRWSSTHEQKRARELLDFVGLTRFKDMPAGNLRSEERRVGEECTNRMV